MFSQSQMSPTLGVRFSMGGKIQDGMGTWQVKKCCHFFDRWLAPRHFIDRGSWRPAQ
jgi:hypothetical protein